MTRVVVRDRGYSRLIRAVRRTGEGALTVGIHPREGRQRYPRTGRTVAEVANFHAVGAGRLPVRDPLATWFDAGGRRKMTQATRRALNRALRSGGSARRDLEAAGQRFVEQIRATAPRLRALAPSTVRAKGHGRILFRTGRLLQAYGFRVNLGRRSLPRR